MEWILIICGILITLFFLTRGGNKKFWNLVNKYPLEAYELFKSNSCWFIIHPGENKQKPSFGDWSGPFFINIPNIGRIKVYGKDKEFEIKQKEFIDKITKRQ